MSWMPIARQPYAPIAAPPTALRLPRAQAKARPAAIVPVRVGRAKARLTASDRQFDEERALPRIGLHEQIGEPLASVRARSLDAHAGSELGPVEIGAAQVQHVERGAARV